MNAGKSLPSLVMWLVILAQGTLTAVFSLTLHYELKSSGYDSIQYVQLLYNVIHGHGLHATLHPPYVEQHWFAIHFSPLLYLLAPLYAALPHVETLTVLHSYAIALAAWPIFLVARHMLASRWQGAAMAILYLINPYVVNAGIWEFHEVGLAPLVFAWMLWAVVHKKRRTLLLLGLLLAGIKEHYGLGLMGFGLLWALYWREWRFGLALAAAGLAIFLAVVFAVMPAMSPLGVPAMMNTASSLNRFGWLYHPLAAGSPLPRIAGEGLQYGVMLLIPFLFMPLAAGAWLLPALADGAVNMLSAGAYMRNHISYHSAALMPVILIAYTMVLHRYVNARTIRSFFLAAALAITAGMDDKALALPYFPKANGWEFSKPRLSYAPEDGEALAAIRTLIPPDSAVSAQNNALPHLPPRLRLYHFPEQLGDAEYVVLYTRIVGRQSNVVLWSNYSAPGEPYFDAVDGLLADKNWGVVFNAHHWLVLQKGAPDHADVRRQAEADMAQAKKDYGRIKDFLSESSPDAQRAQRDRSGAP